MPACEADKVSGDKVPGTDCGIFEQESAVLIADTFSAFSASTLLKQSKREPFIADVLAQKSPEPNECGVRSYAEPLCDEARDGRGLLNDVDRVSLAGFRQVDIEPKARSRGGSTGVAELDLEDLRTCFPIPGSDFAHGAGRLPLRGAAVSVGSGWRSNGSGTEGTNPKSWTRKRLAPTNKSLSPATSTL
jgi:hypothetical protein